MTHQTSTRYIGQPDLERVILGVRNDFSLVSAIVLDAFFQNDSEKTCIEVAEILIRHGDNLLVEKIEGIIYAINEWQTINSLSGDSLDLLLKFLKNRILGGDSDDAKWANIVFFLLSNKYSYTRLITLAHFAISNDFIPNECHESYIFSLKNLLKIARESVPSEYDFLQVELETLFDEYRAPDEPKDSLLSQAVNLIKETVKAPYGNAILFIHGFGGSFDETWGKFPEYIGSDNDYLDNHYSTHFYDYPSKMWTLPVFGTKVCDIQTLADGLKTIINIGLRNFKQIDLICHSLGGLIAKKYLVEEQKLNSETKINRILFFATPHDGTELANVAQYITWKNNQLRQLCKNSDFINGLNRDWETLGMNDKYSPHFILGGQDRVVPSDKYHGANIETLPHKDHSSIIKPDSKEDIIYGIVKLLLLEHNS